MAAEYRQITEFIGCCSVGGAMDEQQLVLICFLADYESAIHSFATITADWYGFSEQTEVCLSYCSYSLVASFPSDYY